MKRSLVQLAFLVAAVLSQSNDEEVGQQRPKVPPQRNEVTSAGCYKSKGDWKSFEIDFLSMGSCSKLCTGNPDNTTLVSATGNGLCYCGDNMPPKDDLVDDENCNHPCDGYPQEACMHLNSSSLLHTLQTV